MEVHKLRYGWQVCWLNTRALISDSVLYCDIELRFHSDWRKIHEWIVVLMTYNVSAVAWMIWCYTLSLSLSLPRVTVTSCSCDHCQHYQVTLACLQHVISVIVPHYLATPTTPPVETIEEFNLRTFYWRLSIYNIICT